MQPSHIILLWSNIFWVHLERDRGDIFMTAQAKKEKQLQSCKFQMWSFSFPYFIIFSFLFLFFLKKVYCFITWNVILEGMRGRKSSAVSSSSWFYDFCVFFFVYVFTLIKTSYFFSGKDHKRFWRELQNMTITLTYVANPVPFT